MGPVPPRPPVRWAPVRLLTAYGLGAVLIAVPVDALGGGAVAAAGGAADLPRRSLVAAVPAGAGEGAAAGEGFALDRDGQVLRIGADGSAAPTADLGRYSTPFGTSVAGRTVFGGVRCDGGGCDRRVAELAVLDGGGRVTARVEVARSEGWPTRLDGLAPVGPAGGTRPGPTAAGRRGVLWVNGGGRLHEVAVDRATGGARLVGAVPWPGGEPCLIDGGLYDLAATGGVTGRQGAWLGEGTAPTFRLVLRRWTAGGWQRVAGGTTTMANGRNAHCAPGGYEVRDGTTTLARWSPATGWRASWRRTARHDEPRAAGTGSPRTPRAVDHYNMCSAACGPGVRPHTRDLVVRLVERHRPAALSLNEACYDDAVHLLGHLTVITAAAGYSALDSAVGCPGAVKRFGNVVMVGAGLEPGAAWWGTFATQAEQPCDHRTGECRGMVCVEAGTAGAPREPRVFCSAHLESPRRDAGAAGAQVAEYAAAVDARFGGGGGGTRVLAGDLNLGRAAADDVLGPAGYRAARAVATVGSLPGGAAEIDWIYDDDGGDGGSRARATRYCDRRASDHCYLTTAAPPVRGPAWRPAWRVSEAR